MTTEGNVQRMRAAQAGFAMRSYREAFVSQEGKQGLTQEELLRRMAAVDREYGERFSHATVSRWESGATRPTAHRLKVFGSALGLSTVEVAGLIQLAGLVPDFRAAMDQATSTPSAYAGRDETVLVSRLASGVAGVTESRERKNIASILRGAARLLLWRCLPLGALTVIVGYVLSFWEWDDDWMPVAYAGLITVPALAQGLLLPDPGHRLREFFWVTLFFLLTTPLLQFAPIGMDHYGLNMVGGFSGTHMPYMLSLLVNLALASAAGVMFYILWGVQDSVPGKGSTVLRRALGTVLPPVGLVYAVVIVISNASIWIQFTVLMPAVAASFAALLALGDPSVRFTERDRQFLLSTTVTIIVATSILGSATVLGIYLSPDLPMVLPDHNLIGAWEIDFVELGYSREEALDRLNLGYLWHAMSVFAYLVLVVGGNLIVTIFRIGNANDQEAAAKSLDSTSVMKAVSTATRT